MQDTRKQNSGIRPNRHESQFRKQVYNAETRITGNINDELARRILGSEEGLNNHRRRKTRGKFNDKEGGRNTRTGFTQTA